MTEVAILTPDPADATYAARLARRAGPAVGGRWPRRASRRRRRPWTDHVERRRRPRRLSAGPAADGLGLPPRPWALVAGLRGLGRAGAPLANPAAVLALELRQALPGPAGRPGRGHPADLWADDVTQSDVEAAFAPFGGEPVVVKPTVSGGAWRTLAAGEPDEPLTDAPEGPAMIQPYPADHRHARARLSLLFFGGELQPRRQQAPGARGDFRIQVQYGGRLPAAGPSRPPRARWRWPNGRWPRSTSRCCTPASTWSATRRAAGC